MSTTHALEAKMRSTIGKGASRRLRRLQHEVPGVVYGGNQAPVSISVDHNKLFHALENEAFYSQIIELSIDGKKEKVVLKDLQRHHYKNTLFHADFMRVRDTDKVNMRIPLHFINTDKCPGVKKGGIISHHMIDLEVRCMAKDLPEFIEIDLGELELDQVLHISELKLPAGVTSVQLAHDNDMAVTAVHATRGASTEDAAENAAADSADGEAKK